uniref:Uncharacterized protein n=1 Tax=Aegilops tauschii subsp. strangulata TaxID=200361 RepID=A0A453QC19_AEGTS
NYLSASNACIDLNSFLVSRCNELTEGDVNVCVCRTRWACLSCFPWICGGGCSAVQLKGPSCCCGCPRCCVGSGGCGGGPSCGCSCSCAGCSSSCACPACTGCGATCCGGVPRPRCCLCS